MKNSLRILLVLGIIMGVFPVMVSAADPITDADFAIDFIIDDGNSADLHDENGWLVAGSGISSTIRATYIGNGSPDIHYIKFVSVEKDTYGDVVGDYVRHSAHVPYDIVFSASKNVAGNAPILVQINYTADDVGYDYSWTVYQKIDHNMPMKIQNITFESEVTIDDEMDITMTMEDAYGNTVNSLYEDATGGTPEGVTFSTTSYAGSGFYDDNGFDADAVTVPVDAEGIVSTKFKMGTEAGPKYLIHLVPDIALDDKWLTITGIADAKPYAILVSVDPNVDTPPYIPADGESKFYLTYNLYDQYGNPSTNQTLHFNDSVFEDEFTRRTNSYGEVKFTFGPFDQVTHFTIHAYAVENTSVTVDQVLRFTNTSPEDMLLTANPQSMPSADVPTATGADLLAKVTDESGNGVPGESVSFSILVLTPGYSEAQTEEPFLAGVTAITDGDGIATMHFTPGVFETDIDNDDVYNATASDSCQILATWGSKSRTIDLEWKNYPYLRVETEVDPETVQVGDPVEVTIRLIGDGWKLTSDPIDVMLCADRSGSMSGDRIVLLKNALKVFNGEMTDSDSVGLTSFATQGKVELSFIKDLNLVNSSVDSLVATGMTSMRHGLYLALNEFATIPQTNAVRAVILLSDGDYNYYGDPLARGVEPSKEKWEFIDGKWQKVWVPYEPRDFYAGTIDYFNFTDLSYENQNMSVYANNNNITIYTISFGSSISVKGKKTLETLATSTGGKYEHAPDNSDLAAIYKKIAGELKTEAGVDTTMDVLFDNIELNNVSQVNDPDDPILEYEYEDGISTLVKSWNTTGSPLPSEDNPNIMGPLTLDQRNDWANRSLNFDATEIGTIHLGQTWQAKFRLNVSKPGNINIFGEGSLIIFNNGEDTLALPKTYITAVPYLNATGINFTGLQVSDLTCVEAENSDVIENYLTMEWNLNYSGTYPATQCLYYQKVGDGIWTTFGEVTVTGPVSMLSQTQKLYVADFPPGEYKLRVRAMAPDAPDSVIETPYTIVIGQGGQYFIRLG